jgi:hypothetical protein
MLPSSNGATSEEALLVLGMTRLVELLLEPGNRACTLLATPVSEPGA